ncbi:HNH endonuclease [Phaeovulum vinaykumarii]|nr:HNH endonuclease [Phaeovulum vinaykumarii]
MTRWTWSTPTGQRKLQSVADHVFWSYTLLSVTREIMVRMKAGQPNPFPNGRTKETNIRMSRYQRGLLNIRDLERDQALAEDGIRVCAHCGSHAPRYHRDHLIPRSRLGSVVLMGNVVRACPACNLSRGNRDLMIWHHDNETFPSLGILRRYLKICYFHARDQGRLDQPAAAAVTEGLPFDPRAFPRRFPPVNELVWDHAWPN